MYLERREEERSRKWKGVYTNNRIFREERRGEEWEVEGCIHAIEYT